MGRVAPARDTWRAFRFGLEKPAAVVEASQSRGRNVTSSAVAAGAAMSRFHPKPDDQPWLVPYLALTDWIDNRRYYEKVFGFELGYVHSGPGGMPIHAEFRYKGEILFMCAPEGGMGSPVRSPRSEALDHSPVGFMVYVDDVDAFTTHALEAGGIMTAEPEDQFYGDRRVIFTDPSGYTWTFASRVTLMSEAEISAAASKLFG
jgi:uncharacterized glyoxalase superfamily protein PhnB